MKQLEEAIEEIRRLMIKSTKEVLSTEKLKKGGPARVAGWQQQQQSKGARGQLQEKVWDPGIFQ